MTKQSKPINQSKTKVIELTERQKEMLSRAAIRKNQAIREFQLAQEKANRESNTFNEMLLVVCESIEPKQLPNVRFDGEQLIIEQPKE